MRARVIVAGLALVLAPPIAEAACKASYYGKRHHGRQTASGEPFNMHALTAAHRTYRFGAKLRVSRKGRSVVVTINDRGPAKWTGRCIDLSKEAARQLGMIRAGVAAVEVEEAE